MPLQQRFFGGSNRQRSDVRTRNQSTNMEIEDPNAAIEAEVRALLVAVRNSDHAAKVTALRSLTEYFMENGEGVEAYMQKAEHRRAVDRLDGGHSVVSILQLEIDIEVADSRNRDVVLEATRFLANWCVGHVESFKWFSDNTGIGSIR